MHLLKGTMYRKRFLNELCSPVLRFFIYSSHYVPKSFNSTVFLRVNRLFISNEQQLGTTKYVHC